MTQWVNVGGVWKKVVAEHTRVSGTWRRSAASFVNVSGTNRFYSTVPTLQFLYEYTDTTNRSSYTVNNVPLGTESSNRRIFAFVATDYGPSGTLNLAQNWNVGGTNYSTTLVSNSLSPGFLVSSAYTYYIDRHTSSLSDVIPTGTTGTYSLTISTNGAISYGISVSFYALYDMVNYTPTVSRSGSTTSTLNVTNITPGTQFVGYAINRSGSTPSLTCPSFTGTLRDTYNRTLSSTLTSAVYTFAHTGNNIIASDTFTTNGTGTAGDSRIVLFGFR